MKTGNIPKKLKFFIRKPEDVRWRWDDVEGGEITNKVCPCYVSDADNKATLSTGESWAGNRGWGDKGNTFETLETNNEPFTNLRIITLEIRDKGGRAYKVCADIGDKKNLYFDLKEDVLLDSLIQVGINAGGVIPGEFIFARVGSQMKPIRLNSHLYTKMVQATEFDKIKPIDDLVVGGIYKNKRGDEAVYLGQYWARDAEIEFDTSHYRYSYYKRSIKSISLKKAVIHHVFTESWKHESHEHVNGKWTKLSTDLWFYSRDDTGSSKYYSKGDPIGYGLTIVKKHSFKEKIGQTEVPDGFMDKFKERTIARYSEKKETYPHMCEHGLFGAQIKLLTLSKDRDFIHPLLKDFKHA